MRISRIGNLQPSWEVNHFKNSIYSNFGSAIPWMLSLILPALCKAWMWQEHLRSVRIAIQRLMQNKAVDAANLSTDMDLMRVHWAHELLLLFSPPPCLSSDVQIALINWCLLADCQPGKNVCHLHRSHAQDWRSGLCCKKPYILCVQSALPCLPMNVSAYRDAGAHIGREKLLYPEIPSFKHETIRSSGMKPSRDSIALVQLAITISSIYSKIVCIGDRTQQKNLGSVITAGYTQLLQVNEADTGSLIISHW